MNEKNITCECCCDKKGVHSHSHEISCGCGCEGVDKKRNIEGMAFSKKEYYIIFRIIISAILLVLCKVIDNENYSLLFLIVSAIICGVDLIIYCCKAIARGRVFNENFLMLVASVTAFVIGEGFEGSMIIVLYRVGALLEDVAIKSSQKKIDSISKLKVDKIHLISEKGLIEAEPTAVCVESLIQVNKGERIPIDGILLCGGTELDVKAITGESKYTTVMSGENVYSGSINLGESIIVKTTNIFSESTSQKIVKMVEEAQDKKAKSQKFITKFASIYTPVVCGLALLIAIIPPLIDSLNFLKWIYKALAFLVVSCPCALVISVPLAFFVGVGGIAKNGVLIKSSLVLENLSKTNCVVFDKTGTITYGKFEVENIITYGDVNREKVIEYACALEQYSSHPIACVLSKYKKSNLQVDNIEEISGCGIRGVINGDVVSVGNTRIIQFSKIERENSDLSVYVCFNGRLVGEFILKDKIKDNACDAINSLKKIGVSKIVMLSGDLKPVVERVQQKVGIDYSIAELLPNEKVEHIEYLKEQGYNVTFVGDGINDSPSIVSSDVGVAMGGLGSDIAIENADVVVLDDDLGKISKAILHSKKISNVVKQNILFSLGVKLAIMVLSLFIKLPMGIAMFADIGVMLLALINSLRCSK